jgi:hypothetical protein
MVREVDLDFGDLVVGCMGNLEAAGWADFLCGGDPDEVEALAHDMVADGAEIAARYPAGMVLRPTFNTDSQQWHYTPTH